jgi:hypothetical protein
MSRTALLAAAAVILSSPSSFAQFGGMGGGGGGMGGQGAPTTMAQSGRAAGARGTEVQRSAQVEMEGGQRLSGKIDVRPLIVDSDLGQYAIAPIKIKAIRFLKPADDVKPGNEADEAGGGEQAAGVAEARQKRAAMQRALRQGRGMVGGGAMMMDGMVGIGGGNGGAGMVADPSSRTGMATLTRGKVVTTADTEVIGMIHIPGDFRLELEFGALTLAPDKLRSITFKDDNPTEKRPKAEAAAPGTHDDAGRPASGEESSPPRYFRQGSFVIVISPVGGRVTLYNLDTKKSESLELSGSKEGPLEVVPIVAGDLVALMVKGPNVTRIAVADPAGGTWHAQALRKPIDGQAVPIVAPGVAVYALGRDVYAYSAEAKRWDVAELPDGVQAAPVVGPGTATIEGHGHIYTFSGKTGKWDHVDIRAILDGTGEKK